MQVRYFTSLVRFVTHNSVPIFIIVYNFAT
nr:MAG TPA: hypothetical protein [Bacteriophage sp.]